MLPVPGSDRRVLVPPAPPRVAQVTPRALEIDVWRLSSLLLVDLMVLAGAFAASLRRREAHHLRRQGTGLAWALLVAFVLTFWALGEVAWW